MGGGAYYLQIVGFNLVGQQEMLYYVKSQGSEVSFGFPEYQK